MAEEQQAATDAAQQPQKVTIDGVDYDFSALSEKARNQVANLRVTDQEINRIKQQLAIYQTARAAFARALSEELPGQDGAAGETAEAH